MNTGNLKDKSTKNKHDVYRGEDYIKKFRKLLKDHVNPQKNKQTEKIK